MNRIARTDKINREALFINTAHSLGFHEAVIEKDFWVCWALNYLFQDSPWIHRFSFKGGTSLSKAYGLIDRFSEDIDLILDWRILGIQKNEPWIERSNRQQDLFNKHANELTESFLKTRFVPTIKKDLSAILNAQIACYIEEDDPQTVKIRYPSSFSDQAILKEIRLEIGALAAWTPAKICEIFPYAAKAYPRIFSQPSTLIRTVLPERTFWEKVTILHREAFRVSERVFPSRYSRHYYDLYRMAKQPIKSKAFEQKDLLAKVVRFKEKFYRCPWANYELAEIGTIRLSPPSHNVGKLADDYLRMQNMIFGEKPSFETILREIELLESEINRLC